MSIGLLASFFMLIAKSLDFMRASPSASFPRERFGRHFLVFDVVTDLFDQDVDAGEHATAPFRTVNRFVATHLT
jgi:hypothetical protein